MWFCNVQKNDSHSHFLFRCLDWYISLQGNMLSWHSQFHAFLTDVPTLSPKNYAPVQLRCILIYVPREVYFRSKKTLQLIWKAYAIGLSNKGIIHYHHKLSSSRIFWIFAIIKHWNATLGSMQGQVNHTQVWLLQDLLNQEMTYINSAWQSEANRSKK